jgi:hypothetical protein
MTSGARRSGTRELHFARAGGSGGGVFFGEVLGCVDESDHAAGVWCVAEMPAGVGVVFLAEEADVVA